jgi:hypothetical protein
VFDGACLSVRDSERLAGAVVELGWVSPPGGKQRALADVVLLPGLSLGQPDAVPASSEPSPTGGDYDTAKSG